MTETRKLELTKESSELFKSGIITEEDFEAIKNNLFSEAPHDYKEELSSFRTANELLEKELIDEHEYDKLKQILLRGEKTKALINTELLARAKTLYTNNCVSSEDYESIKDRLMFDSLPTPKELYESNFKNIESYHRLFEDGLLSEDEYANFRKTVVQGKKIADVKELNLLRDYLRLFNDGYITEDEHSRIRADILSSKKNNNYSRPSFIKDLYKLKEKGFVSEEEFNSFKSAFIEGSPLPNDESIKIIEKNSKYVETGLLNSEEFELVKDRAYGGADVLTDEKIQNITEYKKLYDDGTINEEEFCKFKKDILKIGTNKTYVVMDAEEIRNSKKKTRQFIIICCISVAILTAGVYVLAKMPVWKSEKAVNNLLNESTELLDNAEYETVMAETSQISNQYSDYLKEEDAMAVSSLYYYAEALDMLDLENGTNVADNPRNAIYSLEYASQYEVAQELTDFIERYDGDTGHISGVMTVDVKKYEKGNKTKVNEIEGVFFNNSNLDESNSIFSHTSANTRRMKSGANTSNGTTDSDGDSEEKEDEPKEEKYSCSCCLMQGFIKKNKSAGLSKDNITKVFKLSIDVNNTDAIDSTICKKYEAMFAEEESTDFIIKATDGSFEGKGTFDGGVINIDFGNGVTIKLPDRIYVPSSGSKSYSKKKDYSAGSDWEKYDSDSDGRINDKEFQDATGDYIDKYFEQNGTGGDLNAYDYNGNREMETHEFQDAVNDYMNKNGY